MLQIPRNLAIKGRVCRNCSGPIPKPKGNNLRKKVFCTDNCRKEFHKNNGVSVYKLKVQVKQWVREEWNAIQREQLELQRAADQANRTGVYEYDLSRLDEPAPKSTALPKPPNGRHAADQCSKEKRA